MQTATAELVRDLQFDDAVEGFSGNEGANDNEGKWRPEFQNDGDPRIISPETTEGDDGPEGKKELEITAENFNTEEIIEMGRIELSKATGMLLEDLIARPDIYIDIYHKRLNDDRTDFIDKNENSEMELVRNEFGESSPINVERMQLAIQNAAENIGKFIRSDTDGYKMTEDGVEKNFFTMSFIHTDGYVSSITFEFRPHEDEKAKDNEDDEVVPIEAIQDGGAESLFRNEGPEDEIENTGATATGVVTAETAQVQEEDTQSALERFFAETVIPAPTPSTADSIGDRLLRAALFFEPQVTQQETQPEIANEDILSPIQPRDLSETKAENDDVVAAKIQSQPAFNSEKIVHSETQAEIVAGVEPEIVSDSAKMEEEKEETSEPEATVSILNAIPTIKVISREFTEVRQASESILETKGRDDEGAVAGPELFTAVDFATEQESTQTVISKAIQESTLSKAPVESGIRLVKVDAVPAPITREIAKVVAPKQVEAISPRKPDDTKREIDEEIKPEVPRETNTAEVVETSKAENSADEKFSNEIIVDTIIENTIFVENENRARGIEATQKEIDIARDEIIFIPQGGQTDRLQSDLQMIGARMSASAANDNQQIAPNRARSTDGENTFPTQSRSGITMRIAA